MSEHDAESLEQLLTVGMVAQLNAHPSRKAPLRNPAVIRGWQKGGYVLLEGLAGHTLPRLPKGHRCTVCFISMGRACGFDAEVLGGDECEVPQVRLSWPSSIELIRMRQHERIETQLACSVDFPDGARFAGLVTDLSVGGCCLQSLAAPAAAPPTQLTVSLEFPNGCRIEGLTAVVRSARQASYLHAGCQFVQLDEPQRQDLFLYVSTTLAVHRHGDEPLQTVLLLDAHAESAQTLATAFEEERVQAVVTRTVVDAFFRLRVVRPMAFLIGGQDGAMDPGAVARAVRMANGLETLPLYVYGVTDNSAFGDLVEAVYPPGTPANVIVERLLSRHAASGGSHVEAHQESAAMEEPEPNVPA